METVRLLYPDWIVIAVIAFLFFLACIGVIFYCFSIRIIQSIDDTPLEDKTGLYDFIHIKDNIINIDHIVNIRQIQSVKEENYKIIIELDDSKEPLCFDFDDDWRECNDVFEQIQLSLDAANIIAD